MQSSFPRVEEPSEPERWDGGGPDKPERERNFGFVNFSSTQKKTPARKLCVLFEAWRPQKELLMIIHDLHILGEMKENPE